MFNAGNSAPPTTPGEKHHHRLLPPIIRVNRSTVSTIGKLLLSGFGYTPLFGSSRFTFLIMLFYCHY